MLALRQNNSIALSAGSRLSLIVFLGALITSCATAPADERVVGTTPTTSPAASARPAFDPTVDAGSSNAVRGTSVAAAQPRGELHIPGPGVSAANGSSDDKGHSGMACGEVVGARPARKPACRRKGKAGRRDPEARCDPEFVGSQAIGSIFGKAFTLMMILDSPERGPLAVTSNRPRLRIRGSRAFGEWGVTLTGLNQHGAPKWQCFAASERGNSADTARVGDAMLGPNGNVVLGGLFWGKGLHFGGESLGVHKRDPNSFLAVLSPNGRHIWSRSIPGRLRNRAHSVTMDAQGNVIVAGTFLEWADFGAGRVEAPLFQSFYVAKYDLNGRLLWVRTSPHRAGATRPVNIAVVADSSGELVIAGGFSERVDFGKPLSNEHTLTFPGCYRPGFRTTKQRRKTSRGFLVRLAPDGRHLSTQKLGSNHTSIDSIKRAPNGDLIVAGRFIGPLSLGGTTLDTPPEPGKNCDCDFDCVYQVQSFVARFDSQGDLRWQEAMPQSLFRIEPGPGDSTVILRGIAVAFRRTRWHHRFPSQYRYELEIRDRQGQPRWSRSFERHDVFAAASLGHGNLGLLVRKIGGERLSLLTYAPAEWRSAGPPPQKMGRTQPGG